MEYAINNFTARLELASTTSGRGQYSCPVCKARVGHRSGAKRAAYFAHWPGEGTPKCENFAPGHYGQYLQDQAAAAQKKKMELRLLIPTGEGRAGWSLELVLPPCRACRATVLLDVGGRIQPLNMLGMPSRRCVTAEFSAKPYRIVSFDGKPDPSFEFGVERECPGLPLSGAAAFTASGRGALKSFPRAQELRSSETFALLWNELAERELHAELSVDKLQGRQGWSLALVTIPDSPSPECAAWLQSFTGLSLAPPRPSVILAWPFLARSCSVNSVECFNSDIALLSAGAMPVGEQDQGPTIQVQSASGRLLAKGVERSLTLFAFKPGGVQRFKVEAEVPGIIEEYFSFSLHQGLPQRYPEVELVFTTAEGGRQIVPLHRKRCAEVAAKARKQGMRLEYLSMPPGAKGMLRVDGPGGRSVTALFSEGVDSPHNRHMCLPPPSALAKLASVLADSTCSVEIDFRGLGRLYLAGVRTCVNPGEDRRNLPPVLRSRLLSFMLQLRLAVPAAVHGDDTALVEALATLRPEPSLVPHYRSLVKEVLACGFKLKRLEEGVSP